MIDAATFQQIIRPNIHLIRRVMKGQMVVPDFEDFCEDITDIFGSAKKNNSGAVATYIPQLARVNERNLGLAV